MKLAAASASRQEPSLTVAQIAQQLGGASSGSDGWWNARCPAHEDRRASLGLKDADDGGLIYCCKANCDKQAIREALTRLGLLPERVRTKEEPRGKIVTAYNYVDEAGALQFQVVRFKPKSFRQRRPKPGVSDDWIWKLGDVRRVLYKLPELLAADPTELVLVVEGEKDVDRLWTIGLVATTNPQGAGKWSLTDRTVLVGRHVVVLPDNDDAGRKHAREVAQDLTGKAASVRILELPGLPAKGDVSDWLDADGTTDELRRLLAAAEPLEPALVDLPAPTSAAADDLLVLDPSDPLPSAERFVELHHTHHLGRTLHRSGGSFWAYTLTHYRELNAEALRAALYPFLAAAMRWIRNPKTGDLELVPFKPTATKVTQVVDALAAHVFLPDDRTMPAWLDDGIGPGPRELVPLANGLLHLPTGRLVPHTPRYFGGYALTFAYEPAAAEPVEWLRFLASVWPDDAEARNTLQEVMGLLLTTETRYQKIILVVGPKRSGKGTVGRVIRAMLGACNVAGPTLSGLATNFGLQPLIGKPVAIISDARLSGRADATVIAERLLSISGEDAITVDRKHVEPWTGTLPTRFVILTNELPRIADASGALASRFVVLTMRESFFGREDYGLTDRLIAELPGIFLWAVAGWRRLVERGHFVMPRSSADAVQDIESLSSPTLAFVRACCEVKPAAEVPCEELFERWCRWCTSEGRDHPGTAQSFGRDLKAAAPGVEVRQPRRETGRVRVYTGIAIRSAGEDVTLARDGTRDLHCSALFNAGDAEGTKRAQERTEEIFGCSGVDRVPSRAMRSDQNTLGGASKRASSTVVSFPSIPSSRRDRNCSAGSTDQPAGIQPMPLIVLLSRGWTLTRVAQSLGVHVKSVARWRSGMRNLSQEHQEALEALVAEGQAYIRTPADADVARAAADLELLIGHGWTLVQLAKHLGVHPNSVARWRNGTRKQSQTHCQALNALVSERVVFATASDEVDNAQAGADYVRRQLQLPV